MSQMHPNATIYYKQALNDVINENVIVNKQKAVVRRLLLRNFL